MRNENFVQTNSYTKRAVGVFKSREETEKVLRALKDADFDMERVSLIARHVEDVKGVDDLKETHGNEAKEGAAAGATAGTVLGGIGGFLVGVGVLAIPGIGPLLAAGVGIPAFASTLAGAGIGAAAGGIIGGLVGLGIPEEEAKVYNERVKSGDYLLLVNGTDRDLGRVESIMRHHHVEDFNIFDAPDLKEGQATTTNRQAVNREVASDTRNRGVVTDTRDIDGDGHPEVIIVDHRQNVR